MSIKVLVVDDEPDILDLLILSIQSRFPHVEVLSASSGKSAITILNYDEEIKCVFCDYRMPNGNGGDVFKAIQESGKHIPFILCSSDSPEVYPEFKNEKPDGLILKPFEMNTLFEAVSKFVGVQIKASKVPVVVESEEYVRLRLDLVLKIGMLNSDIYMKLPNGRFIKILQYEDVFEKNDFEKYALKKIEYLYIKQKDAEKLTSRLISDINTLTKAKAIDEFTSFEISLTAQEVTRSLLSQFGLTTHTQSVIKETVDLAVKTIENSRDLKDLLKRIYVDEKDDYVASHSVLLSNVCGIFTSVLSWTAESTLYKISLAAFMHDIAMGNITYKAYKEFVSRLESSEIVTEKNLRDFALHPEKSADFIRKMAEIPPDVDVVVSQHHELPNGTGFPHKINFTRIHPLSALFVVAHKYVDYIYDNNLKNTDISDFLSQLPEEFKKGAFKQIINGLATALISEAA